LYVKKNGRKRLSGLCCSWGPNKGSSDSIKKPLVLTDRFQPRKPLMCSSVLSVR
jgi:hypothetical protein